MTGASSPKNVNNLPLARLYKAPVKKVSKKKVSTKKTTTKKVAKVSSVEKVQKLRSNKTFNAMLKYYGSLYFQKKDVSDATKKWLNDHNVTSEELQEIRARLLEKGQKLYR
jgi:hypothetical protein